MNVLGFYFLFCALYSFNQVFCDGFKCPVRGKIGELKVQNVLNLIAKQNGYQTSIEAISPVNPKKLINEYHDLKNGASFIDFETTNAEMNRRYYYHSVAEKLVVDINGCKTKDLSQDEKVNSIKEWFEPANIVESSEIFKNLDYLGPTTLMIYANKISDKASFIGSEVFEGRSVNHWFYCTNDNGPYIDFYFDVKTSLPYRFSLYYPEWIETQEFVSENETRTVKKQVDSESKYVYNFFSFKPLVITSQEPIPYPLGYGCRRKDTQPSTPLPDFSKVNQFTMDMEAVISYSYRDPIKSTARVMKRGDVISYEIQEEGEIVRSIEMPPPLGRYQVDEQTGECKYLTDIQYDDTILTYWPYHGARRYNLLLYLLMKPSNRKAPVFISNINLGPMFAQEYRAVQFHSNYDDAIIDYYYMKNASSSVPTKVTFKTVSDEDTFFYEGKLVQAEVTIINYNDGYFDYEDRFDVSGCYDQPGNFTWFQLFASNPWIHSFDAESIKEQTLEYLTSFIPITRIGPIHVQQVAYNLYVTVKLYDRVHFIEAYRRDDRYTIPNPSNVVQRSNVEDCEQLCSTNPNCDSFSYCNNQDCSIRAYPDAPRYMRRDDSCVYYSVRYLSQERTFADKNFVTTSAHILQQIRDKVSAGQFYFASIGLIAEDMFIVNGPEEIGDVSREVQSQVSSRLLRTEYFPMIKTDRNFNEAQFKIEKVTLNDCFMACLNDDDCNTLSYCVNDNKECILSKETSSSLKDTIEDKTSHSDGCNIYEKSYINSFHEYPGKTLVLDAISIQSGLSLGDCAKTCVQSDSFKCESFDYCQQNFEKNTSFCFLHTNHIEIDRTHGINMTNWKFAETGCTHFSKKSELDYEHKVGLALKDTMKDSIVGTFDYLSLEHCASKCNLDANCFTFEFCETIDYNQITDSSSSLSTCFLTNLKPTDETAFDKKSKNGKICSIYINRVKIGGKSGRAPAEQQLSTSTKSNNFNLVLGLSTIVFILAFAGGFIAFKFAQKRRFIL